MDGEDLLVFTVIERQDMIVGIGREGDMWSIK
jgi:hypothetical protein